jgi:CHASE3 domain sensor protein
VSEPLQFPHVAGATPPAGPDPMFVWVELNRRVDSVRVDMESHVVALETRIERMDMGGTRGVDGIRIELRELRADLNAHEEQHVKAAAAATVAAQQQESARRWFIGLAITGVLAVLANPLLVLVLTRGR